MRETTTGDKSRGYFYRLGHGSSVPSALIVTIEPRSPSPTKLIALDVWLRSSPTAVQASARVRDHGLEKKSSRALPSRRDDVILLL